MKDSEQTMNGRWLGREGRLNIRLRVKDDRENAPPLGYWFSFSAGLSVQFDIGDQMSGQLWSHSVLTKQVLPRPLVSSQWNVPPHRNVSLCC